MSYLWPRAIAPSLTPMADQSACNACQSASVLKRYACAPARFDDVTLDTCERASVKRWPDIADTRLPIGDNLRIGFALTLYGLADIVGSLFSIRSA